MSQRQPPPFLKHRDAMVAIYYEFRSSLFTPEADRFVQHIMGNIVKESSAGGQAELMGKLFGYRIHFGEAVRQGYGAREVFSTDQDLLRICTALYDFERDGWKLPIQGTTGRGGVNDVLLLFMMELLPAYRRHDIGLHAAQNFFSSFVSPAALCYIDCSPLQFTDKLFANTEWYQSMHYERFSGDRETANNKLLSLFQRGGFSLLPDTNKTFLHLPVSVRP